jgi:hypothetical protein
MILYRNVIAVHVETEADVIDYEVWWTSELYVKVHSVWPHVRYKHKSYFIFIVQLYLSILHTDICEASYKDSV